MTFIGNELAVKERSTIIWLFIGSGEGEKGRRKRREGTKKEKTRLYFNHMTRCYIGAFLPSVGQLISCNQ